MRRRLDLASALVHEPRVLFLDEPTTGLDPVSRKAIWEEVSKLNDEGTTVFLTTQYLEEADQLADRVGIIDFGRIVAEDTPGRLKAQIGRPHLEIKLLDGAVEQAEEVVARFGKPLPSRDGAVLVELERGAAEVAPVVRALDEAGLTVEALDLVEPTLDDVFLAKTGHHLEPEEAEGARRARMSLAANLRVIGALGARAVKQTFRRPQLIAPIIVFPSLLLAIQTGGAGRGVDLPGFPARQRLPRLHPRRGDDPVDAARRQQRRDRARGRHRDGIHGPPAGGADLSLRDRARAARRDGGAGRLLGDLVHRRRADLRRPDRGGGPGRAGDDRSS